MPSRTGTTKPPPPLPPPLLDGRHNPLSVPRVQQRRRESGAALGGSSPGRGIYAPVVSHSRGGRAAPALLLPQDGSGRTPLFWATEYRHDDLVELLLTHGADVAARDQEGNTCLHWAANVGSAPIARRLLEAGAEVNAQNNQGDSPLHVAARERRYQCLVLLLAHGAKVSLVNREGQTPPGRNAKPFVALPQGPVERTLSRDISRGFERVPIPCLNGMDGEPCPSNFLYVTQDILTDSVALPTTDWIRRQCCWCTRTCSWPKCPCIKRSHRKWYTLDGQLVPTSGVVADAGLIYECHMLCSCSIFCPNRVVQRGIRYFGELISPEEAGSRDHTYLYRMETQEGKEYMLDGQWYSCVGRFLNHFCDPNLVPVRVALGHEIPTIAFFTTRDIQAGEELGFDYGDPYWMWRGPGACKCQSLHCRFRSCPLETTSLLHFKLKNPHSLQASPSCDQPVLGDSLEEGRTPLPVDTPVADASQ